MISLRNLIILYYFSPLTLLMNQWPFKNDINGTLALIKGFPGDSDGKKIHLRCRRPGSIPGLGRSSAEGSGNPLQCSCLENPMDRGAWWAVVGRKDSDKTERLRTRNVKVKCSLIMFCFIFLKFTVNFVLYYCKMY